VPALFEAGVVVRAHTGHVRDLLAAQARHPADATARRHARVGAAFALAALASTLLDLHLTRHHPKSLDLKRG
jgi:hypothetical protein